MVDATCAAADRHSAMVFRFPHENLDCYKLAVEVARWFQQASFPKGRTELKQQGQEAVDSTVLNIAEGSGRRRGARRRQEPSRDRDGFGVRMLRGARSRAFGNGRLRAAGEAPSNWGVANWI